jgi:hypothetical protein
MTFVTRRRARAVLPSLSLLIACSTGKPNTTSGDDDVAIGGTSATGGSTSGGTAGTAAVGGTAASGQGGSGATGGSSGASATGGASGSAATGGTDAATGGSSATGGASATGGSSGSGGATGGDAGSAAMGGGTTGGSAGMVGSGGTDPGICQSLSVTPMPQVPTVEILVDTSSSMFETTPTAWSVLYTALMDPMKGAVQALQSKIRFGFASYEGHQSASETDMACATMTTVPPAEGNYTAIDMVYSMIGAGYDLQHPTPMKWETPTDYAINYAANILTNYMPTPAGQKYILLVTDGNPNTCAVTDPQCGQDYAIKAAQDAFAAGIGLFVLGVGDIVTDPANGCPTSARCGLDHLQDMANAGVGAAVQPAPGCDDPTSTDCQFRYQSCNVGNALTATYTTGAPDVGTPYAVNTAASDAQTQLATALSNLLNDAIPCTVDMDAIVTGDPSLGIVEVGGMPETYNDPDGWILEANAYSVTLQGAACMALRSGAGDLTIEFPCDPSGNPIAVHR